MPKYDDLGRNELDSPDDAWRRADILLDAHHKLAQTHHHQNDIPSYAIERLITDLMHYAHECNKGKAVDSGECVDFDHVIADARQQFIKEREAAPELHEPLLDPNSPQRDSKFDDMQNKMYSRQLGERNELNRKQEAELKNQGPSQALSQRHDQELTKLTGKFQEERERRTREYQEARRIREELEKDERTKALGLDNTPEEGEEHG